MSGEENFKRKLRSLFRVVMGRAKRTAGELTGRPDIVLRGEAQETKGRREGHRIQRELRRRHRN